MKQLIFRHRLQLNYQGSASGELRHRATLRLLSAPYEVPAQVVLFDCSSLEPGESCYAQLRRARTVLLPNHSLG